jgi:hypothetical protein
MRSLSASDIVIPIFSLMSSASRWTSTISSQMIFWNNSSTLGDAKAGMVSPVLEDVVVDDVASCLAIDVG